MSQVFRYLVLGAALVLTACSGGGGGDDDSPPLDTSNYGRFNVDRSTVTYNATQFSPSFTTQVVNIQVTDMNAVAGVRAAVSSSAPAPWLSATTRGSGGSYQLELYFFPIGVAPGTYSAVVNVGTVTADGRVLQSREVTVTFKLTSINIFPSSNDVTGTVTLGHSSVTRNATIRVTAPVGQQWKATTSLPWVHVPTTIFTGTNDVPISLDAAGLALGNYSGLIVFTSQTEPLNAFGKMVYLGVTMPTLTVSANNLILGGLDGTRDSIGSIEASLNTGTNAHPFTVTLTTANGISWLASNATAGQISQVPTTLSLTANRGAVPPGQHTGTVRFETTVQGQSLTAVRPVTFNVEGDGIIASSLGVGLSQFPGRSVLTRRVRISSTQDRTGLNWVASADRPWLSVTGGGTAGSDLVITANPAGLTPQQVHRATVTVSSTQAPAQNQQVIRVALWVGSTDPAPVTLPWSGNNAWIATNPTEPFAYITMNTDSVSVYNVYSGALVNTFTLAGSTVGVTSLSDDGSTLFIPDPANGRIVALDASTGQELRTYSNTYGKTVQYIRPDGHPMLIGGDGRFTDLATGTQFPPYLDYINYNEATIFKPSSTSRYLFAQERGLSSRTLAKYRLSYSSLVAGNLTAESVGMVRDVSGDRDICVSADDQRVYASKFREFGVINSATLAALPSLPGEYTTEIDCSWNGWVVGGTEGATADQSNVRIYDSAGALVTTMRVGPRFASQVSLSADATRLVALIGGELPWELAIGFASTPPF